ncbi:Elongator complex protein 1 [Grifola frondosa]|uniref:Elongator complex protein 1 n=1 Tax=Grifola frondosa TaxID=5627 RepID=A0A1C7LZR5_GRIFR|nr:Elongator complex protein 1 [Grifola frondosa]
MRSLSLSKSTQVSLTPPIAFTSFDPNSTVENVKITAVAIDLDQDALYLWKIAVADANQTDEASSHVPTLVTTFATPIPVASNPWSSHLGRKAPLANGQTSTEPSAETEVLSLHVVSDTHSLALVTRAGDIATIELDIDAPTADVVGSVEAGILCAEWSPDDAFLVIVTGADKLILMTSTFDVLSEDPLHPTDFGEDAPTNVGWGAKHTQFQRSLGKAAAASSLAPTAVGASPDDDGRARVSWRGDGAFFVVGVLESGSTADSHARRVLRVYARDGTLQSTAEAIPGLEHSLSWRPSGNLIVGTQRFGHIPGASKGIDGLGQGREGRHDVVFFERNGLRHGEFELREQHGTGTGKRKWGYRVREVAWSADSNVLSVWIEGMTETRVRAWIFLIDPSLIKPHIAYAVQLWTTGNYHWYLKQEIAAPAALDGSLGRFTAVRWHPEHALRIILTTSSDVIQRTYSWDTFASPCTPPTDSGSVAVLDGTSLLLTPFRTQNVPPPMCAHVLSLSFPISSLKSSSTRTPVPVHASFSSVRDMLAVLWESGVVELFDLHTRLGPGRGKAMDPARIWAGIVGVNDAEIGASSRSYRQILVSQYPADGTKVGWWDRAPHCTGFRDERGCDRRSAGDGEICEVDLDARSVTSRARFPEFCFFSNHVLISDSKPADVDPPISVSVFIGLSHSGKLYIATADVGARTLVTNANSFVVASGFLIFTTTAHVAQFAPFHALVSLLLSDVDASGPGAPEWETRRVDGARVS